MKKAFTLIEVIVVLVILAIIVLISMPIINSIIDKSKISANKRSVDNYAHAVELAQAEYRLEHGFYTYDINNLNIKYSGKEVICDDIVLNENGSIYISKCKIDGLYIEDLKSNTGYYSYGSIISDYKVGEEVTYNGIDFYIIKNSSKSDKSVTLLKKMPIESSEIIDIVEGTEIYDKLSLNSTYLYMQYYYEDQCNSINKIFDGCSNDYSQSAVKQIIDGWSNKYIGNDLMVDNEGYKARLISNDELFNIMEFKQSFTNGMIVYTTNLPEIQKMFQSGNTSTFTMAFISDDTQNVLSISYGRAEERSVGSQNYVRPVITIKKSAIEE